MLKKIVMLILVLPATSVFAQAQVQEPDPILFMTSPGYAAYYNQNKPGFGDQFSATVRDGLNAASNRISNTWEHAKADFEPAPKPYPQGPQMIPMYYPTYMNRPGPAWRQAPPLRNFAGQSYTPVSDPFRAVGYGNHSMTSYSSATYTGLDPVAPPRAPNPGTHIIRSNPNPYVASTDNFWTNSAADKPWDKPRN